MIPELSNRDGMHGWQLSSLQKLEQGRRMLILPYGARKSWVLLEHMIYEADPHHHMIAAITCRRRNMLTWRNEIKRWYPGVRVIENMRELETAPTGYSIWLIPQSELATKKDEIIRLLRVRKPGSLLMDESTRIKNPDAKMTKAALEIALVHPNPFCMTGKAMPEHPKEIYSQFAFAYGTANPFGRSYYAFLRRWFIKHDYGYALRLDLADEFYRTIRRNVVVFDEEGSEEFLAFLSGRRTEYILETYSPSQEQRKLLDRLFTTWSLSDDPEATDLSAEEAEEQLDNTGVAEYTSTMAVLSKAYQICSGFYYDSQRNPVTLKHNPKVDRVLELLETLFEEKPDRQVIIWHHFKVEREMLRTVLSKYRTVVGPDEEALTKFANKEAQIILMPAATSEGFNELAQADTAIFLSLSRSQEKRDQAEARNTGPRQLYPVANIIDLGGDGLADSDTAAAMQAKSFSPKMISAIVNKYSKRREFKEAQAQAEATSTEISNVRF